MTATGKSPAGGRPPHKRSEQPLMKALRAEHRHMATVMQLFAGQLRAIEAGELVDTHVVYEIMDYMVSWPDRFHHPREDLIYARAAELNGRLADEVDTLQRDHDHAARRGRALLREIERWRGGEIDGARVVKVGRDYIDHSYQHMNWEEKLVFPNIEAALSPADWRELAQDDRLRAVASPVFGPQVQRQFRNMARKLRRNLRRAVERGAADEWTGLEALMEAFEVVSMSWESTLDVTGEHLRDAFEDARDLLEEYPLAAAWRIPANNTRVGLHLLGELLDISRLTLQDLSRVNRERRDRLRLLERGPPRR